LRKGRDHPVEPSGEFQHNANPAVRATSFEQPLPTRLDVRFPIRGLFDGQHNVREISGQMRMALQYMVPGFAAELNAAPIGASDKEYHKQRR